jgi:exopolysaccharide biosynthesis polyprenyl glycosylphosphotransferase
MPTSLFSSSPELKRDVRSSVRGPLHKGTSLGGLRVVLLLGLDATVFCVAWQLAELLGTPWESFWRFQGNLTAVLPVLAIKISVLIAGGFYKSGEHRRNYLGLVKAITLAEMLLLLVAYFYQPSGLVSRSHFLLYWLFSLLLILIERFLLDRVVLTLRRNGILCYPALLIADPADLGYATRLIEQEKRYKIVQILPSEALDDAQREQTLELARQLRVAEVFIASDAIQDRMFLCWQFQTAGIVVHLLSAGLDSLFHSSKFWTMNNSPVVSFSPPSLTGQDFLLKRLFDLSMAGLLVILLFPLYSAIAVLIRLNSPGPIFYRQTRVGLRGTYFRAWKFRTMVTNADQLQQQLESQNQMKDGILFKLKEDPRVTKVGKILRQYSLDELPQLFNVLLGEMSLVGPRPLPIRDVEKFADHHFARHEVLPGITGLWQVSGRSDIIDFEDVVQLDLDYIQNWSLVLDMTILLKTIKVVFQKTGAY